MRLVLAAGESLNAVACDRLIARLAEDRASNASEVVIDLQAASYVDPYGAACLSLIARQVAARGQQLTCILPAQPPAQRSAVQTGLIRALRPLAELRNMPADSLTHARSRVQFCTTSTTEEVFSRRRDGRVFECRYRLERRERMLAEEL